VHLTAVSIFELMNQFMTAHMDDFSLNQTMRCGALHHKWSKTNISIKKQGGYQRW
jgi:hypothetical protein